MWINQYIRRFWNNYNWSMEDWHPCLYIWILIYMTPWKSSLWSKMMMTLSKNSPVQRACKCSGFPVLVSSALKIMRWSLLIHSFCWKCMILFHIGHLEIMILRVFSSSMHCVQSKSSTCIKVWVGLLSWRLSGKRLMSEEKTSCFVSHRALRAKASV